MTPQPFRLVNAAATFSYIFICDHASNVVPTIAGPAQRPPNSPRHIAWDIGAGDIAGSSRGALRCAGRDLRHVALVIDCNRHPAYPTSIRKSVTRRGFPAISILPRPIVPRRHCPVFCTVSRRCRPDDRAQTRFAGQAPTVLSIHSMTPAAQAASRGLGRSRSPGTRTGAFPTRCWRPCVGIPGSMSATTNPMRWTRPGLQCRCTRCGAASSISGGVSPGSGGDPGRRRREPGFSATRWLRPPPGQLTRPGLTALRRKTVTFLPYEGRQRDWSPALGEIAVSVMTMPNLRPNTSDMPTCRSSICRWCRVRRNR